MTDDKPAEPASSNPDHLAPPGGRTKPLKAYVAAIVVVGIIAALGLGNARGFFGLLDVAPALNQSLPNSNKSFAAFAKASPLLVFEDPSLTNGRKQDFEFGNPYEVIDQSSEFVMIKLSDGTQAYVRSAHVTTL
jgi:hypothetical protein